MIIMAQSKDSKNNAKYVQQIENKFSFVFTQPQNCFLFFGGYSCQIGVFVVALLSYCVSK